MRSLLSVALAVSLAACGGSPPAAGPTPTPCPASSGPPDPGGGTTLRGFVFEGAGTDGAWSGRPVACARVVVVTSSGSVELSTDGQGFFDVGSTPTEFSLHVFPPQSAQAASVSVLDGRTANTGQVVRVYLPLNRPAANPGRDPGGSLQLALTGRLVDGDGNPQVGSYPAGGEPGEPGTTGFVWWGAAARRSAGSWVDSGITDSAGRFQIWTHMGGERLGTTRPVFAGNYDGRRDGGDVLHYTAYAYLPAVDVLAGHTADVGTLTVRAPDTQVRVTYDPAAREVLAGWGPNGLGFTYVLSRPSVTADCLEFGRAFTGPFRGGIATEQQVPAPLPLASGAPGTLVLARSFAFDASVTDNTGELSYTEVTATGMPPALTVSYLAPPRNFAWNAASRTFTWSSLLGAGGYEVYLHDPGNRLVWVGVRGALQNSVALPFTPARGGYYAYVKATDLDAPRGWLAGQVAAGRKPAPSGVRAPVCPSQNSTGGLRRESYSRTLVVTVP
ncbi:MAG: hypothetical protein QN144_13390 [Armatimonadota bacterium]|nr:hypothetical protein [Armatimonadota bacterium]